MPPNVIDPYVQSYSGEAAAKWSDMAPAVASPAAKKDSVLQLYIPAENTTIDYGAGKIPGIRMVTDHHAHITAQSPLTTIALGTAAGLGVNGSSGLNIFTDGAKSEEVKLSTTETYHGNKTEKVKADWSEESKNKKEHIDGTWDQTVTSSVKQTYGANQTVHVTGDHKFTCGADRTVIVNGSNSAHYLSPSLDWHYGLKTAFFAGGDISVNAGFKQATFLGLAQTTNVAANYNLNAAQNLSLNMGVDLTLNASVCISRTLVGSSKTQIDLDNNEMELRKKVAEIVNEQIGISTSKVKVIK